MASDDRELANRLADVLRHHNGSMSEAAATALVEEWAPGRGASIITLGTQMPGPGHKARPGWGRIGSDLVLSRAG